VIAPPALTVTNFSDIGVAYGGDGLGGRIPIQGGSSAMVSDSSITHNKALIGEEGAGGSDGRRRGRS
jgi:hypothetical protein